MPAPTRPPEPIPSLILRAAAFIAAARLLSGDAEKPRFSGFSAAYVKKPPISCTFLGSERLFLREMP
jgi:hypothetical protein